MKLFASFLFALCSTAIVATAQVPVQVGPGNIKIKGVAKAMQNTPEYRTDVPDKRYQKQKWLEIEVNFEVDKLVPKTETIDELTFKYTALINGKLYIGEVTHVNIPEGNDHYSVMYMSPRSLDRAALGKGFNESMIDNVWVTVERQGQKLAVDSLKKGAAQPPNLQQVPGLLLQKADTPFQVLWWDRYEAVKPTGPR
jgi:hypothetical protein